MWSPLPRRSQHNSRRTRATSRAPQTRSKIARLERLTVKPLEPRLVLAAVPQLLGGESPLNIVWGLSTSTERLTSSPTLQTMASMTHIYGQATGRRRGPRWSILSSVIPSIRG